MNTIRVARGISGASAYWYCCEQPHRLGADQGYRVRNIVLVHGAWALGEKQRVDGAQSDSAVSAPEDSKLQQISRGSCYFRRHSQVLAQYLQGIAKFHTYSFGNIMLIARQKPSATNVAGVRTWNSLGRFVRRGEKGILILAPMISRKARTGEEITRDNGDEKKPQAELYGFRAVYVFDRLSRDLRPSLCAPDRSRQSHFRKAPR